MAELTREEFLRRCETIYDTGHATREIFILLRRWCDIVARLEGGQIDKFVDYMIEEKRRTGSFSNHCKLHNDRVGYKVTELTEIFAHHCQKCAESHTAWWTRSGFCEHREEKPL